MVPPAVRVDFATSVNHMHVCMYVSNAWWPGNISQEYFESYLQDNLLTVISNIRNVECCCDESDHAVF